MSRKRRPPTELLNFRATKKQGQRIRKEAQKHGLTPSEYMRRQCDPKVTPTKEIPRDPVAVQALTLHIYHTENLPMEEARREAAKRLDGR